MLLESTPFDDGSSGAPYYVEVADDGEVTVVGCDCADRMSEDTARKLFAALAVHFSGGDRTRTHVLLSFAPEGAEPLDLRTMLVPPLEPLVPPVSDEELVAASVARVERAAEIEAWVDEGF